MRDKNKPTAIFFSSHLPCPIYPSAGHQLAYYDLKEFSESFSIVLVFIYTDKEASYLSESDFDFCENVYAFKTSIYRKFIQVLFNPFTPVNVAAKIDRRVPRLINRCLIENTIGLIHCHFAPSGFIASYVKKNVDIEIVFADVLSQSASRRFEKSRGLKRLFWLIQTNFCIRWEKTLFKLNPKILLLSEKDEDLVKINGSAKNTIWRLDEFIAMRKTSFTRAPAKNQILFVGALHRAENSDGVIWFLNEVFPLVKSAIPEVTFNIIGANPPNSLKKAALTHGARVHGFVEDLGVFFRETTIAVVPLRLGAGVKIKTLDFLAHDVPTVSTTVGAEGIDEQRNLYVADSTSEFATVILRLMRS